MSVLPLAACDSCVIVLLEDLDKLSEDFNSVAAQLSSLNASSMAWAQLRSLNKSVEEVTVSLHARKTFTRPNGSIAVLYGVS